MLLSLCNNLWAFAREEFFVFGAMELVLAFEGVVLLALVLQHRSRIKHLLYRVEILRDWHCPIGRWQLFLLWLGLIQFASGRFVYC